EFVFSFVSMLARAVNSGRRLAGMAKAKDVMNAHTQRRHGFLVESLPISVRASVGDLYSRPHGQELHDAYEERLRDNTQTPIPEQVAFRLDWPSWLRMITYRDRRLCRTCPLIIGRRTWRANTAFHLQG